MRTTVISLMLALVAFCSGCGESKSASKDLTRSKAADAIKSSSQFASRQHFIHLCTGYPCTQSIWPPESQKDTNFRDALKAAGYVDFERIKQTHAGLDSYRFTLTNKGKTASKEWKNEASTYGGGGPPTGFINHTVLASRAQFIEITGVKQLTEQRVAQAEFTWKFVPTPMAEELIKAGWRTDVFGQTRTGESMFQLYDDGWRL